MENMETKVTHKISRSEIQKIRDNEGAIAAVASVAERIGERIEIDPRWKETRIFIGGVVEMRGNGVMPVNINDAGDNITDAANNFLNSIMQETLTDTFATRPEPVKAYAVFNRYRKSKIIEFV